jgi:hypothetical protein
MNEGDNIILTAKFSEGYCNCKDTGDILFNNIYVIDTGCDNYHYIYADSTEDAAKIFKKVYGYDENISNEKCGIYKIYKYSIQLVVGG